MSILGTHKLIHPELLGESELKEILKSRCIDFSNHKNLSQSELIELYIRVVLPLPRRQYENNESSDQKKHKQAVDTVNKTCRVVPSLNGICTTENNINGRIKMPLSSYTTLKSCMDEPKQISKKICLYNVNHIAKWNGIHKCSLQEKQDEEPARKRQKITWP